MRKYLKCEVHRFTRYVLAESENRQSVAAQWKRTQINECERKSQETLSLMK